MSDPYAELKALKAEAKREFGSLPGVEGFGIGNGGLRIYVHDEQAKARIPGSFRGVRIFVQVTGGITPL